MTYWQRRGWPRCARVLDAAACANIREFGRDAFARIRLVVSPRTLEPLNPRPACVRPRIVCGLPRPDLRRTRRTSPAVEVRVRSARALRELDVDFRAG